MSEITVALAGNNNANYEDASPARKRSIAVAAALELISARISATSPNGNNLGVEMDKLSHYADQIQAALKIA